MALDPLHFPAEQLSGQTLLLHSSIGRTLKTHNCSVEDVLQALLDALGPAGTLLLPLFNFDFTKGTPFDLASTPSHMGALTEVGRQWPGAVRTGHPIYSFAAIGAESSRFEGLANRSGYGADSPFSVLRELGGLIGVIDLPDQNSMTFYHHVEEALEVPYRFHKSFSGPYCSRDGAVSTQSFSIFVRDLENGVLTSVDRMGERLWSKGLYSGQRPGVSNGLRLIKARALFEETAAVIKSGQAQEYLYDIDPSNR